MRRHIINVILVSVGIGVCPLSAAERADTLPHILDDVEVSAGRASKAALSAAPLRFADSRALALAGVTDASDALHRMAGVTLRDYGGAGGLKTVSVRGFGASHTGVVVDGVPLSDVQSGQIDLSRYSVDNVDNIQMVIGDNDDIFMPARLAATAATVSLNSMPVNDTREVCAKLRAGSFGYINPFVRITAPLSRRVSLNVVGEYTHADNDYPFTLNNGTLITRERRNNSLMRSGHGEMNVAVRPDDRTSLISKVYYYDCSRRLPGPVIYYNDVSHQKLNERNVMAQARLRRTVGSRMAILAAAKYNFASSMYHDENGKYPGGVLDQNYWQREYYATLSALCNLTDTWLADYSADYFHNNLNSNLRSDKRPYRNSVLQTVTAKLHTRRITLMGRLLYSLYLNGAKDGASAKDARRLSPSLSLSVQPIETQLLYVRASYKNIFRMPTFNEAYFDHYGSLDIKPETTDQLNAGVTYTAKPGGCVASATFTADAYLNHVRDMIVAVPYNMFVWTMTNLGKVRTVGADLTAAVTVAAAKGHAVNIDANYSYQRAKPRTSRQSPEWNKQVAYIPRHSGSASVAYENPWVNLSAHATGVGERYTTNANLAATRIAGYVEFGATLWRDFELRRHRIGLRFDLLNIFDRQYCVIARYPMPGRSWRATLSLDI